jgi:hypothetical protein
LWYLHNFPLDAIYISRKKRVHNRERWKNQNGDPLSTHVLYRAKRCGIIASCDAYVLIPFVLKKHTVTRYSHVSFVDIYLVASLSHIIPISHPFPIPTWRDLPHYRPSLATLIHNEALDDQLPLFIAYLATLVDLCGPTCRWCLHRFLLVMLRR